MLNYMAYIELDEENRISVTDGGAPPDEYDAVIYEKKYPGELAVLFTIAAVIAIAWLVYLQCCTDYSGEWLFVPTTTFDPPYPVHMTQRGGRTSNAIDVGGLGRITLHADRRVVAMFRNQQYVGYLESPRSMIFDEFNLTRL